MARRPLTFRQQDLVRALKGAKAVGIEVARIEIDKSGKIVIVTGNTMGEHDNTCNEWDEFDGAHQA